ncbi:hypothetical protein BGZ57DRAFT_631975 [Hyaloscypha finlandica]|nr:hypothetical protein BGZ57DRAFT_631975 [Hyaloscypha finlandica]
MNQDGCMWAVILSSFVTGAAGIMRAAYSPSLTVPVQCEDGASPLYCVCYQPIRGIESGTARLSFTHGGRNKTPRDFLVLPTGTCASMLAGGVPNTWCTCPPPPRSWTASCDLA